MEKKKISHREIGTAFEKRAVLFLEKNGFEIVETNYYCKQGEIDIIAKDNTYIVFVEVKYRKDSYEGASLEAVTPAKQRHIVRSARAFLYQKRYPEETPCRFDVIAFEGDTLHHIKNAFEADYS